MVPAAEADGQGVRRLDIVAEPTPALPGRDDRAGDLRPHCRAGDRGRLGRRHGALHRQHAPEGQCQQGQVRPCHGRQVACRLLGRARPGDRCRTGVARQKALKEQERQPAVKETKVSRTDPEAGYMVREGKPKGFFYLDHRTVDGGFGIITDTFATPANVHDSIVYLDRLDRQVERFGFDVTAAGLDAGYATPGIAKGLEDRNIHGVVGYRNPPRPKPGKMRKGAFVHEPDLDGYRCPQGQLLTYATTDRGGYRHYRSDPTICRNCPLLASCTSNAKAERTITRHVWQDVRERVDANRLTAWGKAIYRRRKETVERSFADAKQLFGHRYARFRGRTRVACQCLIAAAAQNMKKIAISLWPKPKPSLA
ncbi:truncated transposase [Aminobacter sp. Y103A]|nr:truncated transposase [Aminobacter sp. SS-2016]